MSDYRFNGMQKTKEKTIKGETIYNQYGSGDKYAGDVLGNIYQVNGVTDDDDDDYDVYDGSESSTGGWVIAGKFTVLALIGFVINIVRLFLGFRVYSLITSVTTILLIILPYVHPKFKKRYRIINRFLIVALMFFIYPNLGIGFGAPNLLGAFIKNGVNTAIAAVVVFVIYQIVLVIQDKFKIGY